MSYIRTLVSGAATLIAALVLSGVLGAVSSAAASAAPVQTAGTPSVVSATNLVIGGMDSDNPKP